MDEPGYGPVTDWRTGEVLIPIQEGKYVADVERPEKRHRCGICNNGTGVYNPECPGRRSDGAV